MVPQELLWTTASITQTLKHGFVTHYYTKYSLALLKILANNRDQMGALFFFNIAFWERKKSTERYIHETKQD